MTTLENPAGGELLLVTGGAGFIGSHIVHRLAAIGWRIVIADLMRSGDKWRNIAAASLHDLIRPEATFDWLARNAGDVAAVIHMAAVSTTTEPDIDRYVTSNIRLTLDLWEWCAATRTRFIYASSAATYGDGSAGFADDESPSALARLRPLNAYGWSKHVVDRRVIADVGAGRPSPPQWAGLKFFNVYGAHEAHKGAMQSMAAKIVPLVRGGEPVTLFRSHDPRYSDGGQLRDFVYVKDCVAVIEWLLHNPSVNGILNVGTGTARSFLDLAGVVYNELGRDPDIRFVDTPAGLRPQYQYFTQADIGKLRAAGFTAPFHTLESGVRDYLRDIL
jgi:ADP-L-glycero-D-manno-heptose 6-epimerase